jgi:hypothetical protein
VLNLGTLYLISLATAFYAFIIFILSKFNLKYEWIKKKHLAYYQSMFWGNFLRLFLESSLCMALSGLYNIYMLEAAGFWNLETDLGFFWVNLISLGWMMFQCAAAPIFFIAFYIPRFKNWEDHEFEQTWGAVLESLKKD